jgi:hypothetical protein
MVSIVPLTVSLALPVIKTNMFDPLVIVTVRVVASQLVNAPGLVHGGAVGCGFHKQPVKARGGSARTAQKTREDHKLKARKWGQIIRPFTPAT